MTRSIRDLPRRLTAGAGATLFAGLMLGGILGGAPAAEAQQWRPPSQRSTAPPLNQPPAPRNEPRTQAPPRGYVWVPGHWEWTARDGRVWVPGRYMRDRPGYRYVGPEWTFRNGAWVFIPGRWVR